MKLFEGKTFRAARRWVVLAGLLLPRTMFGDVLTQHNDNGRTGANLQETVLTPAKIPGHFGKLAYRIVDGNVYAQPLYVSNAKVANHPQPVNVVIVATEHNSVYAFDADDVNQASTTAQLWHKGEDVIGPHIESIDIYTALNFPTCSDLTTEVGITGTPAIKITKSQAPQEGVVFVAAKYKKGNSYSYKLLALRLSDGQPLADIPIEGSVAGTGFGSTGTGANAKIKFDPAIELNRPGLLLADNTLYIAFGGHCDRADYHGWVFAYDVSNPAEPKKVGLFCTTPNGRGSDREGRAGIWMSGQGPAADPDGNVYVVTGDGTYNGTTDFGDSVVKLKVANGALQVQDWFTPQNQEYLKDHDVDLGSCGLALVPGTHLSVNGGKEGRLYLVDRNDMGKGAKPSLQSFQVTHAPFFVGDNPYAYNIHGTPVIWKRDQDMYVYVCGEEDPVKQYKLIPDPGSVAGWKFASDQPFKTSPESAPYPGFPGGQFGQPNRDPIWMPGGFLAISANGSADGTGILWVTMPFAANTNHQVARGVLRAFDASDVSKGELWDSENTGNDADHLGQFAKFCPPIVANGKVYVATFQQEVIGHDGVHRKAVGGDQPALAIYGLR